MPCGYHPDVQVGVLEDCRGQSTEILKVTQKIIGPSSVVYEMNDVQVQGQESTDTSSDDECPNIMPVTRPSGV